MPARKCRNGEGTRYKDRSKNRWIGEAMLRDSLGNPVRRRVSAKTEKECLKKLKETIARHESGARSLDPSMTIEEFAQQWITKILPSLDRKSSTKSQYEYLCKQYVIPTWGQKKLIEVRIADVDRGLVALAKKDLSKDTVRLAPSAMLGYSETNGRKRRSMHLGLTRKPHPENLAMLRSFTAMSCGAVPGYWSVSCFTDRTVRRGQE